MKRDSGPRKIKSDFLQLKLDEQPFLQLKLGEGFQFIILNAIEILIMMITLNNKRGEVFCHFLEFWFDDTK